MSAANSGSVGRGKPTPDLVQLFDIPTPLIEPVLQGAGWDLDEIAQGLEGFLREAGGPPETQTV